MAWDRRRLRSSFQQRLQSSSRGKPNEMPGSHEPHSTLRERSIGSPQKPKAMPAAYVSNSISKELPQSDLRGKSKAMPVAFESYLDRKRAAAGQKISKRAGAG